MTPNRSSLCPRLLSPYCHTPSDNHNNTYTAFTYLFPAGRPLLLPRFPPPCFSPAVPTRPSLFRLSSFLVFISPSRNFLRWFPHASRFPRGELTITSGGDLGRRTRGCVHRDGVRACVCVRALSGVFAAVLGASQLKRKEGLKA